MNDDLKKMLDEDGLAGKQTTHNMERYPAHSGSGNARNFGQMKDEKLRKLNLELADWPECDHSPGCKATVAGLAAERGLA